MSLARICDRCGHVIENSKNMNRLKLQRYQDDDFTSMSCAHVAYSDVCTRCCRELFNCFISDYDWNDILYSGVGEEEKEDKE